MKRGKTERNKKKCMFFFCSCLSLHTMSTNASRLSSSSFAVYTLLINKPVSMFVN